MITNNAPHKPLIEVDGLSIRYRSRGGEVHALREISLSIAAGESVGIVGESGSGKSTLARAMLNLLPVGGVVSAGQVMFDSENVFEMSASRLRRLRGGEVGMVFQDPVNAMNPRARVGHQLARVLRIHHSDIATKDRRAAVAEMLAKVGIEGADKLRRFPFQFSQGQIQRIMVAAACLGGPPAVLIADEPTTSLDVTVQAQVLGLFGTLKREFGLAFVLISHDLSVVQQTCSRVVVMYAGEIIEDGATETVLSSGRHPYTEQLLRSMPEFPAIGRKLTPMEGEVPNLTQPIPGCSFAPRCARFIGDICLKQRPDLREVVDSDHVAHRVACHHYGTGIEAAIESSKGTHIS